MKKTIIVLLILFSLSGVQACQDGDYKLIPETEVPEKKVKIAQEFSEQYYLSLRDGQTNTFGEEVTDALKSGLTPDKQLDVYKQLKNDIGEFVSMEYVETWVHKSNPSDHIIRFKGSFSKSDKKAEIRVVVNDQNQISGFWIKPWVDPLG